MGFPSPSGAGRKERSQLQKIPVGALASAPDFFLSPIRRCLFQTLSKRDESPRTLPHWLTLPWGAPFRAVFRRDTPNRIA
jgi:hypothetical protein